MDERFGKFVRQRREEKKINLRRLAEILDIAPAYMSDIEKSRRYPPDREKIEKISNALELNQDEKNYLFDMAAHAKDNTVSPDLPDYIMENDIVRVALRKARDIGAGKEDWERIIKLLDEIEEKKNK
ncbi:MULTISPECIES: helix-turn-helix domain-containing protein [unclassified Gemella]|uniref:helix-turn-helix domain-containing protein n=1 Tax=unclassified Gemella TaxID=2624949 RepID=UPI001C05D246|nr:MULTISPECIES: helix-turn-helix domain-containing protein [unclassified Gemella]MBU0279377.1 helix-turn-helix domain-containing protein [Gemella sp. zg-1178]QWQ38518.1 helix-turn-helix domain-containing protein [Gemella sp. zg-570]